MENSIVSILEGYSNFFISGAYSLVKLQKEFSLSEFYIPSKNIRSYYLPEYYHDIIYNPGDPEWKDETFEEYISSHIERTESIFKLSLLEYLSTINSDKKQNAIAYSVLAYLQNYINITIESEV